MRIAMIPILAREKSAMLLRLNFDYVVASQLFEHYVFLLSILFDWNFFRCYYLICTESNLAWSNNICFATFLSHFGLLEDVEFFLSRVHNSTGAALGVLIGVGHL